MLVTYNCANITTPSQIPTSQLPLTNSSLNHIKPDVDSHNYDQEELLFNGNSPRSGVMFKDETLFVVAMLGSH